MFRNILLFISLTCSLADGNAQIVRYAVSPALERINEIHFKLEGRQKLFQDSITDNWLLGLSVRNPYMTGMFEAENKEKNRNLLPWSGEFAGKYLTGAVAMYRLNPLPKLREELHDLVVRLGSLQTSDGYLGPWPEEYELTSRLPSGSDFPETWDTWNHSQMMTGLLEYYRLSDDTLALGICSRIGNRLCRAFLDHPEKLVIPEKTGWGHGGTEFNLTPVQPLCQLYCVTGKEKYLKLALQIVNGGFLRYGDYVNRALEGKEFFDNPYNEGSRWERLHPLMGLADLYWLTGKEDYRTAFEKIWLSIASNDIHNTGGFSTTEMAIGNPFTEGAIETCCTIAWQAMSVEMLKMTGNSIVADMLELAQVNAAYGCWDTSGKWNTYHTGMSGQRLPSAREIGFQIRPGTEELNCCSANAPRGIGILSDWALMRRNKGLVLNWYGPGEITAMVNDLPVKIIQTTDYPENGEIRIRVDVSDELSFPLELRIPFWSEKTSVAVNKEKISECRAGTYLKLDRTWKNGDIITLKLDMSPHLWPGEKIFRGKCSVYYGPVLMALRKSDNEILIFKKGNEWNSWPGIQFQSDRAGAKLEIQFSGEEISMIFDKFLEGGILHICIDNKETAIIDLYAANLKQMEEWHSPLMKNGVHILSVELLKNVNQATGNSSVRIREFRTRPLPVFEANSFHLKPETGNKEGVPWLRFSAKDIHGKWIILEDFNSAGKNNGFYNTWLPFYGSNKVYNSWLYLLKSFH